MFTKKKRFIASVVAIIMALFCGVYFILSSRQGSDVFVRTIALTEAETDCQSIFNQFEDTELSREDSFTSFTGYQTLSADLFEEFDTISNTDIEQIEGSRVKYYFTYDSESNIVTISAELKNDLGEVYIDELSGVGFINEKDEIDAVMNVEGESVLLSEMKEVGLIENCGWFSKAIKKAVKIIVTGVAVAAIGIATASVVVATAGAAAPALVAAGVGATSAYVGGAAVGLATGALFYATVGKAALKAGTAIAEIISDGVQVIVEKAGRKIISFCFDNTEYLMKQVTLSTIHQYQKGNKIYLASIGNDGNTYLSSINVTYTIAVWFMRVTKHTNYAKNIAMGIYTYKSDTAFAIASDASNGLSATVGAPHGKSTAVKLYFKHWHDAKHYGHAFWGDPV